VDWALILIVLGLALAGVLALAAAMAAGGSDRASDGTVGERSAIWQAGGGAPELRILAGLAALARVDLDAGSVEIVLKRGGQGIVVTGSRLPPGRMGETVAYGDGLAGRALAAGRTLLAGTGAIAAPIPQRDAIVGVVVATAGDRPLGPGDVARLEALAAQTGARLGIGVADVRHAG
jgi:hypothetical protein